MPRARSKAATLGGSSDETESAFYEALQRGDIDLLMSCWADDDEIVCVHPGGPRLLGPAAIRAAILAEAKGATEIGDRAEAIRSAIAGLGQGDVLLIAGKGHETGQIVGDRVLHFSDHEAVAAALKELGA